MLKKLIMAAAILWHVSGHAACFEDAAKTYDLDPLLLRAIAQVESNGNAKAVRHNTNGSVDVGLMQINSYHLPRLRAQGVTRKTLIDQPCTSVKVGASILADFVARHGYNWTAVGAYNAGSSPHRGQARQGYAKKVRNVYRDMVAERRQHKPNHAATFLLPIGTALKPDAAL